MWYLSIYYVKEIESSSFSHISCLSLSLRLSFCLTLCHIGGRFYWVLEDSPKQWPSIWSLCVNTGSASQRSHTHHSRGFIPFPIVPISSDSSCHGADQETQRTALLLLISLKPAARTNPTHVAGAAEWKCRGWHFNLVLPLPEKARITRSEEDPSRGQIWAQSVYLHWSNWWPRGMAGMTSSVGGGHVLFQITTNGDPISLIYPFNLTP